MYRKTFRGYIVAICILLLSNACRVPAVSGRSEDRTTPATYGVGGDTANAAALGRRAFFADPYLQSLIDTALAGNRELNSMLQEIEIARNEVRARKGEYLPFAGVKAGAGFDKAGRYTLQGATEDEIAVRPGGGTPDPLQDYLVAVNASWEVDIWNKLHNAKKAAVSRYLSTVEGRNFVVTNLVAEIADAYYELQALDKQLEILESNITLQQNALHIVRVQKEATRVTELAVRKFEAEVSKTQSMRYDLRQRITETENRINLLLGRYPQPIARSRQATDSVLSGVVQAGVPSQLLVNRPDIRQAELDLAAARLDVKAARARFFPSLDISASLGYQSFNPAYLLETPKSLLYSLAGDLTAPLVNRNAIKAAYFSANARQIQAVYHYEQTILNAYAEVANQLSKIGNLEKSYELRASQVGALSQSIGIADQLFRSAHADYMEVLMTQRDALESKFDLVETRQRQMASMVDLYRALGGGWR
ncbi:MAG: efflux transporter outer membrane subunit [Bacteroidetes bacterium]|nr:efflux transporter outer membrane subunit [Bacteroidota bacterium]